jgi:hypothetical protein
MFDEYRNRISRQHGAYVGDTMRKQSEFIADQLWMNSVSTYPVCVHFINGGLPPEYKLADEYQDTIYAHFESKSVYAAGGEEPTYYLTFKPSDMRKHDDIKIGSYISLPNVHGKPEYWLIVHIDDDNQSQRCQILKCNHVVRWVSNGVSYSCLGVLRGGSDAEGIETSGQLSLVDSDIYFWAPTNDEINTISYDTRFLISNKGRIPPLAWKVTSVKDMGPIGLTRFCLSQDLYNNETDNAELMIADYFVSEIPPAPAESEVPTHNEEITIIYNGSKPAVRVGSQKVFTTDVDVAWKLFDGVNTYATTHGDYTMITTDRTLTLKVARNYDLVGTVLTVTADSVEGGSGSITVEVIS